MLKPAITKLKMRLQALWYRLLDASSLLPPSADEKLLAGYALELRAAMQKLEKEAPVATNEWQRNVHDLRTSIVQNDPKTFVSWPVIQRTMFHTCKKIELDYLKKDPLWRDYRTFLRESSVGTPPPYLYLPSSSGNLIHNLYHIAQFRSYFNLDVANLKSIFEFGGGYGSNARLMYSMGFHGKYCIYDLPEFVAIQKYFLSCLGLYDSEKTPLVSTTSEVRAALAPKDPLDLFIATWSMSESPLTVREQIWQVVGKPVNILIAYQTTFENIDNRTYFSELQERMSEYKWVEYEIPHLHGSQYLFGKKNGA